MKSTCHDHRMSQSQENAVSKIVSLRPEQD